MNDAIVSESVKTKWYALCEALGLKDDEGAISHWWSVVHGAYSGTDRYFYDLNHVASMLQLVEQYRTYFKDIVAVKLAAFFHAVVYDPTRRRGNNNDLAEPFFTWNRAMGQPLELCRAEMIATWIQRISPDWRAARPWPREEYDKDLELLKDISKAAQASPRLEYELYTAALRREHANLGEARWCQYRIRSLKQTQRFYGSELFLSKEEAAAANARREVRALRAMLWRGHYLPAMAAAALLPLASGADPLGGRGPALAGVPAVPMVARAGLVAGVAARAARWLLLDRTFVRYPYPHAPPHGGGARGAVVFAASFNPPHLGHLHMLAYLATVADQVHAVIGVNPTKRYAVTPAARQQLLEGMLREWGLGADRVCVATTADYIWRFAKGVRARALYRGVRTWRKDGVDEKVLEALNTFGPLLIGRTTPVPTRFLEAPPMYAHVSSTLVRERVSSGRGIEDLVPLGSEGAVAQMYG